jgi:uncharacterized protein (DUF1015 family)
LATIRPFSAIRYGKQFTDVASVIAPPYDVLDEAQKQALQARHPNNIVTVDLPWMPPKTVGPDDAYEKSNLTLQAWLRAGIVEKDRRPALYPYAQTYEYGGKTFHRRGFICLVKLTPFGEDIIPHEKTYKGPIEDRMKLMRATRMQLSPIFGLFSDPRGQVNSLLYKNVGKPMQSGTLEGVQNDLWAVPDADVENQVIDLMRNKHIYIADGHHRYTTALQYQQDEIARNGGKPLPVKHPANYCMFVLVGMQDDGLLILPTHRLIGGMEGFNMQIFTANVREHFDIEESSMRPEQFDDVMLPNAKRTEHEFGLYDGTTRKFYLLKLKKPDLLKEYEPNQSAAWRDLDVAILQRYLFDEVLQPEFAGKDGLTRGYTANPTEVGRQVNGKQYQIALMLHPTPLNALEELGKVGEVMPQKSTYFYPKLATGMVINPLD